MESVTSTVFVGINLRAPQGIELPVDHLAYLQLGSPSLRTMLDERHAAGDARITLVPVNLHGEKAAVSWLRRVAAHWTRTVADPPDIHLVRTVLTDADRIPEILAEPTEPLTDAAPLCSPAWEHVPNYRHHLLVCRGPRCSAHGAEQTAAAVKDALREHELGDDEVLVTQTGCLFPCNHAPVLAVHPDDVWYTRVHAEEAARIVSTHLRTGRPVQSLRLPRGRTNPGH